LAAASRVPFHRLGIEKVQIHGRAIESRLIMDAIEKVAGSDIRQFRLGRGDFWTTL
jgi:hypothetical protein